MVNINLYKKKRQKFKITTVLFLIFIFLLPVIAFRVTLWTWKNTEISTFRQRFPIASSVVPDGSLGNLSKTAVEIRQKETSLKDEIIKLQVQSKSIENDIVYSYLIGNYLESFSKSYYNIKDKDKVFLKRLNLLRNNKFEVEYYDIPYNGNIYNFFNEFNRNLSSLPLNYNSRRADINFLFLNALEAKTEINIKGY